MKKKSKVCWLIYIAAFVVFLYIGYKVHTAMMNGSGGWMNG